MMDNTKELEKLIRLLTALFPQAIIYLFGSRARGTHRETSDFDIAIDNQGRPLSGLDIGQAKEIVDTLYIPQKIDIVDFNRVPDSLKQHIVQEGIVWKK